MNYHLHRHGQDAVIVPFEELIRRRQAGELTGAEFIWREGMVKWEPLDKILALHGHVQQPVAPPARQDASLRRISNQTIVLVAIAVSLTIFGCIGLAVYKLVRRATQLREVIADGNFSGALESRRGDAMAAASKPVVWTTNTITGKQLKERQRDFRMRQYLGGYEKNGARNPAYDAKAIGFITNWINCNHSGPVNTNLPPLEELSDSLANDPGCNEPLILTIASSQAVELHESIRRLERAVEGFRHSRHSGYPKFYASVLLSDKLLVDKKDRQPVLDAEALHYFKQLLNENLSAHDQEDVAENLLHGWANDFFSRNARAVCDAVHDAGKSYQWFELLLRGELEIKEAWKARGGGYVDTVSETGWRGFTGHLAKAREHLTAAWELRPDSPMAANRMIYVSLGDANITEMRLWFDRIMTAQIDYPGAWGNLRWGLRPRWYGDPDSMLAFGLTALKTRRFDTDVPRMFVDVVSDLESELQLSPGEHIYSREDIWPHLQEMYEGYIAATSLEEDKASWRSSYAVVAYMAGKLDVARQQLEAVDWKPIAWNLSGWGKDLSLMPAEVAARTGADGKMVEAAESHLRRNNTAKAFEAYAKLADAQNTNDPARPFILNRLTTLKLQSSLQQGGWVDFLPADDALSGWKQIHGDCHRLPGGALEVKTDQNGHMLYSLVKVGREFEAKGSFEVASSSSTAFQAGLVMGLPSWESASWYAFRIKRNSDEGDVSSFSDGWSKKQLLSPVKLDSKTNSFWFRFQNGKVTAQVNGVEILKDVAPPKNSRIPTNEFYLGVGAFNDMNTTVIRYRDLQVRKISTP